MDEQIIVSQGVPIHEWWMEQWCVQFINENFFSLGKAAQGFAVRRTLCTPQPETSGER